MEGDEETVTGPTSQDLVDRCGWRRQIRGVPDDEQVVSRTGAIEVEHGHGHALLDLYDTAVTQVYGYLKPRCGDDALAEDLAAETFLSACDAVQRGNVVEVTLRIPRFDRSQGE